MHYLTVSSIVQALCVKVTKLSASAHKKKKNSWQKNMTKPPVLITESVQRVTFTVV